jgi:hypothetical protein
MVALFEDWWIAAVFLGAVGLVLMMVRQQQNKYAVHLAEVTKLNEENRTLNRENHRIAAESLVVLKQIKILLEDRNP